MLKTHGTRFVGKVAVLTASTEGIGLAIARRLGQEKAKVVVSSRKQENVEKAVETLRKEDIEAIGVKCHVSNAEERANLLSEAVKKFGGVDILVSMAGVNPHVGSLIDCPESAWDKAFNINLKSSFLMTKEVIPLMRKQGGGSILYMSSIAAFMETVVLGPYGTSKLGLSRLAKDFAYNLALENIRVNCVASGPINTNFMSNIALVDEFKDVLNYKMPMKRMGTVEEIAGPAAFLLSDDASYITGETLIVAGEMPSRA
ncbi:dehydrogenase/reductase SDR family member 4-like [Phlebotomus argentipes]|uniref:dehydrogenase/reductase SDR family member 4-like n=1 Tax=Phlebotomus argentipes TaxID=94469 RepID=UPI0028936880|nr:dehydrogenase/reductase SDR family member 4-like [Phlebotomus argentipes]